MRNHYSCVCAINDGLVQEWVQKARAVAKSKGYQVGSGTPPLSDSEPVCGQERSEMNKPSNSSARVEEARAAVLIKAAMLDGSMERHKAFSVAVDQLIAVSADQEEVARLKANLAQLIKVEEAYRANERLALERLSDALTGGNAGTWDEIFHAAESRLQHREGEQQQEKDQGAALLPADPSAAVTTEPLLNGVCACACSVPDPVMQADGKFYCYHCSFQTGARPDALEPERWMRENRLLAERLRAALDDAPRALKLERDALVAIISKWRETADIWEQHNSEYRRVPKRLGVEIAPQFGIGAVKNWINWLRGCANSVEAVIGGGNQASIENAESPRRSEAP